jgi:transcriptional regulator with XRE-family HTH domain
MDEQTPLRKIRRFRGMSQMQVAARVGINQSHFSKIERGDVKPTPEVAEKLARFFGHAITELEILYPERYMEKTA